MNIEGPRRPGDDEERVSEKTLTDLERLERAVTEMTDDPEWGLKVRRETERGLFGGDSERPIAPSIVDD